MAFDANDIAGERGSDGVRAAWDVAALQSAATILVKKPSDRPPAVELREAGVNQRDALLSVTDEVSLWRSPEGETFASVLMDGHIEHHPVNSRSFRDWMLAETARRYLSNGRPASVGENAVRDARQHLESRAYVGGVKHEAPLRVAEHGGGIYLDLGTADWTVVKITSAGWTLAASPVPIIRSRRTGAMPTLARKGDFQALRQLLRRLSDSDFILFVAWCLQALCPTGPYPILIFGGEQGSGKTTLARVAQRIVDPVTGDLLQPPGDDRDLIAAAKQGRVLAFDNISGIKPDLADSICRLATGAEIGGRALFTNHDSASFRACRPIILNGLPDLAARGDLADRSMVIRLGQLETRVTERDFWREVAAVLPLVTAALFDALVWGLKQLEEVPTPDVRMADFARLIVAAEPALPWRAGEFLPVYAGNRRRIVTAIVEGDLVATKIVAFIKANADWSGLMSELYALLSGEVAPDSRRTGDWPGNPRWFSDRLTRAAPALRALGIDVTSRQDARGTRVDIRKIEPLAPLGPLEPAHNGTNGAGGAVPQVSEFARPSKDDVTVPAN